MKQKRREMWSSPSFVSSESTWGEGDKDEPHSSGSSSGEEPLRHPRRGRRHQRFTL